MNVKKTLLAASLSLAFPAFAVDYYISDCQAGRQDGCIAGSNSNDGLSAASPKQNLAWVTLSSVAGGTRFFFARGGAWAANNYGVINNANCSITSEGTPAFPNGCIVFDAYSPPWGGTAAPLIRGSGSVDTFAFGSFVTPVERGPYVFKNLKFDGGGTTQRLFNVIDASYFTVEDNEMTGFSGSDSVPVIQLNQQMALGFNSVRNVAIRRNNFHDNLGLAAILGSANGGVVEFNTFDNIGAATGLNHCIYLGGHHGKGLIVRGNTFNNCTSAGSGTSQGGNFTVHGVWESLSVENNTFTSSNGYTSGSIAISIDVGYADSGDYASGECMRGVVVRGNRIGTGQSAMEFDHVPGILIESNVIQKRGGHGILWRGNNPPATSANDCADGSPTIRNNTVRIDNPNGSTAIGVAGLAPTGVTATNNVIQFTGTGSGSFKGWDIPSAASLAAMSNNHTYNAATGGTYSWGSISSSNDSNGLTSNPQFSATFVVPTSKASFSCLLDSGSPARDSGATTNHATNSVDGRRWSTTPWRGACGPNN